MSAFVANHQLILYVADFVSVSQTGTLVSYFVVVVVQSLSHF